MVTEKTGEKATPEEIAARSVVKLPPAATPGGPPGLQTSLLFMLAQSADEIQPWGNNPKLRDRQLRAFITTESLFASALGIVCARNAAFSWFLKGPKSVTVKMQDALETANFGKGWQDLMLQTSVDLYTQDHAAFIEVVREGDTPESPLLSLNHLDAARCYHTGRPEAPVIYQDSDSVFHLLNWWQVLALSEMPSAEEDKPGLQWCALSRMLLAAQVTRNIAIYQMEKTGGRHTKAIHLVKGMTSSEIQDAVRQVTAAADASGQLRYVSPIIVGSVDPRAMLDTKTLELAGLPEGFDEDKMYKWYTVQIAMAFLTDYQEFAPLPGGGLGSSAQSQVLHLKSRGKGPGLYMKLISQALNFKVLPEGVTFGFEEQDLEAEQAEADTKLKRAEARLKKVESGEYDEQAARQEALDVGDMSQETFDRLSATEDITPEVTVSDEEREGAKEAERALAGTEVAGYSPFGWTARGGKADEPARAGPFEAERLAAERKFADAVEKALRKTFARVKKRLRQRFGAKSLLLIGEKAVKPNAFDDAAFWALGKNEMLAAAGGQVDGLLRQGATQAQRLGLAVNFDLVNEEVLRFARRYSDDWWKHLRKTNQKALRNAIAKNIREGAPLKSLIKSLESTFGRARAEMIASTEVTRLYAEGNRMGYASAGVKRVEWRTVMDAQVDPDCADLQGKRWPVGKEKAVPPLHPRCRCWLAPVVDDEALTKPSRSR